MQPHLTRSARWTVGLFFALLLEPTRCGLPPITGQAAEIPPAMVITEGKTNQGFPYLFGGVSSNEREVMEQRAKGYNVKLVFAEKRGSFISDTTVVISDAKGTELVSLATNGPWFYIQMPSGTYGVRATFRGETKQIKDLRVPKDKTVQQTLLWDLGERAEP